MALMKKAGVYVLLVALLAGFAGMLFGSLIGECVDVLRYGVGGPEYLQIAADSNGSIAALGVEDGKLFVVRGNTSGEQTDRTELDMNALPDRWRTAAFYPDGQKVFYLGLFDLDDGSLNLYRVENGSTALLLKRAGNGDTAAEQMAEFRISDFSKSNGIVSFALLERDVVTVYATLEDGSGLMQIDEFVQNQAQAGCVLSDGEIVTYTGGGVLVFQKSGDMYTRSNQILTDFKQVGAGFYSLDRASLEVIYTDIASPERFRTVLQLEKDAYDLNGTIDVAMTEDGGLLLLLADGRLLLDRGSSMQNLSGILYRSTADCTWILIGLIAAVQFVAFVIWLIVCQWRGMRLSLLLRWGALLLSVTVLALFGVFEWVLQPAVHRAAASGVYELAGSAASMALEITNAEDARLPGYLANSIAAAGTGDTFDTVVSVYEKDSDSAWRLLHGNTDEQHGVRAELSEDFDRELALRAQEEGIAFGEHRRDGQTRFCYYRMSDDKLILVSIDGEGYLTAADDTYGEARTVIWIAAAVLLMLFVYALAWVVIRARYLIHGLERINAGESGIRLQIESGDEMESLGRCVNTLVHTMDGMEKKQEELAKSYRRFVPERVLSLLGKKDLKEVDKQTVASRKMATMMVWFRFPQPVYEKSGQALFDNLNEIIERTTPIIAQNGGTVFNFAYDGYDAVFEGGAEQAISTAVAVRQEILSINNEREMDGKACVDLRIALDEGSILMGLAGDENQMEPIAVSSCFSVTKRLIGLCKKLDAGILCTEAVAAKAEGYGIRYIGKCVDGGNVVRAHEIYDGDPFEVRRVKAQTAGQFAEGVYTLYSLDFVGAKRIFLNLVHHNMADGGAKYYLFLADELEKRQDQDINLDYQL